MKEEFITFLRENDLYDDYARGLKTREARVNTPTKFLNAEGDPKEWIISSFVFSRDEIDFWFVVHDKWMKTVKKLQKERRHEKV